MALRPERRGRHQRSARQVAARRVVPAVWSERQSERRRSEVSSVRPDAAVAPSSCFRRVVGRRLGLAESVWWQAPAAAWRRPVGAASARAMASPSEMKAAVVAA